MKSDILVIGGGIMGLCCAWKLAQQGKQVTLLEQKKCGQGATSNSFGALIPYRPDADREIAKLQWQSLWSYPDFIRALFEESGIDVGYKRIGRLHVIQSERQLGFMSARAEMANENWPQVFKGKKNQEILTPEQTKEFEPEIGDAPHGAMFCRVSAFLEPVKLIAALRAACMSRGVDIVEETKALGLIKEGSELVGARTTSGVYMADKILLASGAWTGLLENIPQELAQSIKPVKGQMMILKAPDDFQLKHLVRGRGVYVCPLEGGRVVVGASKEPELGFDESVDDEVLDKLLLKAEDLVPGVAECKVLQKLVGHRPLSLIKKPFMGKLECEFNSLYACVGHGGIGLCLGPVAGELLAKEMQ